MTNQEIEAWNEQAQKEDNNGQMINLSAHRQMSADKQMGRPNYEAAGYSQDRLHTESDAQRSTKPQPQQSHELVFKVKLNQEEYNMYMREKALRNQRLGIASNWDIDISDVIIWNLNWF